jgi:superfamily II DNA or RNA helicase
MFTIRELLDELARGDNAPITRLCEIRGVGGRSTDAKCEALARSYRGVFDNFLGDLRKEDLVKLLGSALVMRHTDHVAVGLRNYPKETLFAMGMQLFRDGEIPDTFSPLDEDDGDEDNEGEDYELRDHRSNDYDSVLQRDFAFSSADAAQPLRAYQERAITKVISALDPEIPKILHLATGGGKTRVANTLIMRWLAREGGPVLWITKDWRLLYQAARDASRRHQNIRLSRIGGDGTALHPLSEGVWQDIVYSTVQTITRRLSGGIISRRKPSLVVWDECHWGERGKAGKVLTVCKRASIPVLGLTATPRATSRYEVAFSKSFRELVDEGFLARPLVMNPVQTGVRWRPEFRNRFEDVTKASLRELAKNKRRNELIVDHYTSNAGKYGKTIVFACNIEHVKELTYLFDHRSGITARGMHSQQFDVYNQRALQDFRTGAVQVLVNMEMLTHGIDVPDARTVFLCRPTTSDILFAQMVGRASRRDESSGKNSFFVVEFTDNVQEHGDLFETAQRYFTGSGLGDEPPPSAVLRTSSRSRARVHGFDPRGAPTWIPEHPDLPESVRGLWYREGQTFGIEFELTTLSGQVPALNQAWWQIAETIRSRLAAALPGRVANQVIFGYAGGGVEGNSKDSSVWNVEYDASAGWEVTSRVLSNLEGFVEVDVACRVLDELAAQLELRVSHKTGTHVHIGWLGQDVGEVKRAIQLTRLFEPALGTLVAPSRLVKFSEEHGYDTSQPNAYCKPVSAVFSRRTLDGVRSLEDIWRIAESRESRYVTFNVRPLSSLHTVEVRLHNGTIEARKILLWVSLWQQILWAAAHRSPIPDVTDSTVINPQGDIIILAQKWLPDARQPQQKMLLHRLATRRAEIVEEQWKRNPILSPWLASVPSWVVPPP